MEGQQISQACNRLGLTLMKTLAQSDPGNIFISPFSLANAITMLYCGARTETATEINEILQFQNMSEEELRSSFELLLSAVEKSSDSYSLEFANAAMIQRNFSVHSQYKKDLEESFHALLLEVNFAKDPELVVAQVNQWVKDKTKGMIEELIKSFIPLTVMVILNAVYFKGTWEHQFEKEATSRENFFNNGEEGMSKKVDMMHLKESFEYARKSTYQALKLPYKGKDIAMMILLPRSKKGLAELESQLSPTYVEDLAKDMLNIKVKVSLPKFRVEYSKSLVSTLKSLGMLKAFSNSEADLTGISDLKGICVSEIMHKAVIEVNEEGSEAAGATAAVIVYRSLPPRVPEFTVEHPFLFTIYNTKNNLNLFTGRITEL
ncbi:leukocyte elastase inhibitor [Nephila pilipes]|uniref:Leukocyte elastase inhibitor n=1 Tax=Nephila pilipes TaxID=299642 RepID=A0A8X6PE12_NEPPI|nr:leukocyte elastase inhibitor [Nephila pilipes]GFT60068.1 leukocyte elastase inhibitor [Nephila pilipes]GFT84433.1 leukocyte elastase inhibitor [Nephila pilipes]GFU20384.1 leukocyte elastase inhibitor [Nephila pilipes]